MRAQLAAAVLGLLCARASAGGETGSANGAAPATLLLRVEVLGLLKLSELEVLQPAPIGWVSLHAQGDRVALHGELLERLRLEGPARHVSVRARGIGRREYAGALEVRAHQGRLALINEVPLEEYVAAVVGAELPSWAPAAAREALAVVARSFALSPQRAGHLCDQTHCQVYRGRSGTDAASRRAAEATAGEVLRGSAGAIAPTLHHAACGGRTQAAASIWPGASAEEREAGEPVPDPDPDGRGPACSPRYGEPPLAWTAQLTQAQLDTALGTHVRSSPGAEQLRIALGRSLGWGLVLGNRFTLAKDPDRTDAPAGEAHRLTLRGIGLGHGVGLCQRGAVDLATKGFSRHQILSRYFPRLHIGGLLLPKHPIPG